MINSTYSPGAVKSKESMGFSSFVPACTCLLIAVFTVNMTIVTCNILPIPGLPPSPTDNPCDQIFPLGTGGNICMQQCPQGGCQLNCPSSDSYGTCYQNCTGGNCVSTCAASDSCAMRCESGNCITVWCTARFCGIECGDGICDMNCRGEECVMNCTGGECL